MRQWVEKRVVQKIYKCDLNNLSSITTLWFIVLLIMLQEEVITHIMNVYIMLLMCDVTISWVLKLVRFFQLQILLITYCCQFLALQKLAIWLPNCDCVQLTSETSYSSKNIGVNALTKSSSNWYFLFWYRALPVIFFLKLNENVYVYQSLVFFKGKVWC